MKITSRNQVVERQKLNLSNRFAGGARDIFVPNEGSGNSIKNIVTGEMCTFSDPDKLTTNIVWNADGSITPSDNSKGNNPTATAHDGMTYDYFPSDFTYWSEYANDAHLIFTMDIEYEAVGGTGLLFGIDTSGDDFKCNVYPYASTGTTKALAARLQSNDVTRHLVIDPAVTSGRLTVLYYWDVAGGKARMYINGELAQSFDDLVSNPFASVSNVMRYGVGTLGTKLWAMMHYRFLDISEEDVADLAKNIYQVLETSETEQAERSLNWNNTAGQGVAIPVNGVTNGITASVVLSKDMSDIITGQNSSRNLMSWDGTRNLLANLLSGNFSIGGNVTQVLHNGTDITADLTPLTSAVKGDKITMVASADTNLILAIGVAVSGNEIGTGNSFGNLGVSLIEVTDDDGTYLFNCDQNTGATYLTDLYGSGKQATLHNFPDTSGYVLEKGSHDGVYFPNDASMYARIERQLSVNNAVIEVDFKLSSTSGDQGIIGTWGGTIDGNGIRGFMLWHDDPNGLQIACASASTFTSPTGLLQCEIGRTYKARIEFDVPSLLATLKVDGVTLGTCTLPSNFSFSTFSQYLKIGGVEGITRELDGTVSRFYYEDLDAVQEAIDLDLTKTDKNIIPNAHGADVPLVGFNQVYYRPIASEDIIGYYFGSDNTYGDFNPNLVITGDFKITVKCKLHSNTGGISILDLDTSAWLGTWSSNNRWIFYFNSVIIQTATPPTVGVVYTLVAERVGTEVTFTVTDEYGNVETVTKTNTGGITFDGINTSSGTDPFTVYGSIDIEEAGTLTHSIDMTTGDSDSYPDTAGDSNVEIKNIPTAGFKPVIEKQVFTVGVGKNYETLHQACSGEENPTNDIHQEFLCFGNVRSGNGDTYWDNNNSVEYHITIKAGDNYFKAVRTLDHIEGSDGAVVFMDSGMHVKMEGIQCRGTTIYNNATDGKLDWVDCLIDGKYLDNTNNLAYVTPSTNKPRSGLYNSVVTNFRTAVDSAAIDLVDCILWNNAGQYSNWEQLEDSASKAHNVIIGQDTNRFNYGVTNPPSINPSIPVEGLITWDANHPDAIMQNVDVGNDVLVDPNNGDFRIKETYQSNMTGMGLHGTNILENYWQVIVDTGTPEGSIVINAPFQTTVDGHKVSLADIVSGTPLASVLTGEKQGQGSVTVGQGFNTVATGHKTALGAIASAVNFAVNPQGNKQAQGSVSVDQNFGSTATGHKQAQGTVEVTFTASTTTSGHKQISATIESNVVFTVIVTGEDSVIVEDPSGIITSTLNVVTEVVGYKVISEALESNNMIVVDTSGQKETSGSVVSENDINTAVTALKEISSSVSSNQSFNTSATGQKEGQGSVESNQPFDTSMTGYKEVGEAFQTGMLTVTGIVDGEKQAIGDITTLVAFVTEVVGRNAGINVVQILSRTELNRPNHVTITSLTNASRTVTKLSMGDKMVTKLNN